MGKGRGALKGEVRWPEGARHTRALANAGQACRELPLQQLLGSHAAVPGHVLGPPPRRQVYSPLPEQPQRMFQGPAGYYPPRNATEGGSFLCIFSTVYVTITGGSFPRGELFRDKGCGQLIFASLLSAQNWPGMSHEYMNEPPSLRPQEA